MSKKILHIMSNDKFAVPFIDFIENNQIGGKHIYLYFGSLSNNDFPIPDLHNVDILNNEDRKAKKIKYLLKYFYTADKIIIHGLFNPLLVKLLYFQPWLLKKCYWVMWGGDLYYHELARESKEYELLEKWRKRVIGNMRGLITYVKGDYRLAQKWYGATGEYYECFMYPSNLYKEYDLEPKEHKTINIQVGNSADPTNNHLDVFGKLKRYANDDIRVIVPLSYGNQEYAKKIIVKGQEIFGDKFEPLTKFLPFEKYLDLLAEIDIAIFNHNRQQAMGNTITLLGLGKKVYMRSDTTPWSLFTDLDVKVYNVDDIVLDKLPIDVKSNNKRLIKNYFSERTLLSQLQLIYGEIDGY